MSQHVRSRTPASIERDRERVLAHYSCAEKDNMKLLDDGDVRATTEYIFPNQKEDAHQIVTQFQNPHVRALSITKLTKIGMDGLMIEIAKLISTHPDDTFVLPPENVLFITGMSSTDWERNFKAKIPRCFVNNVHHHGQLQNIRHKLQGIRDAVIIIDEIDCGDKEGQKLHNLLKDSGILDIDYMDEHNIRFIFVSATIAKQLKVLESWGSRHVSFKMSVPPSYIGHATFLERGIIQEYYPVNTIEAAQRWIREDIMGRYGNDYRVHFIRIVDKNKHLLETACRDANVDCLYHTSYDRISDDDMEHLFAPHRSKHTVVMVKGLMRRANLIPNAWKMQIGAMHEHYVNKCDTSVAVQGFPGRMSGYWRDKIEGGHITGPYRTSIRAMREYLTFYEQTGTEYTTNEARSFVETRNIRNLVPVGEQETSARSSHEVHCETFDTQEEMRAYFVNVVKPRMNARCRGPKRMEPNADGWYEFGERSRRRVYSYNDIMLIANTQHTLGPRGTNTHQYRCYACYVDVTVQDTVKFVIKHYA